MNNGRRYSRGRDEGGCGKRKGSGRGGRGRGRQPRPSQGRPGEGRLETFLGLYKKVSNFLRPSKSHDDNQNVQSLKDKAQEMTRHLGSIQERISDFEETGAARNDFSNVHSTKSPTKIENPIRMVATVNREECLCCGLCVDVCREHAITMDDIATIDPDNCSACGSCIDECPNQAISLVER